MKAGIKYLKKYLDEHLWIYPVFIGFASRLFGLTRSSIWHDEGYTMWLLRYNFAEIVARTARDVHPPFYYLVSKVWVSILGNSVFSIRFLSLLFSIGIIYFAYRIVEILFNKRAAFWTGIFIGLSPFMIRFGQEARMYGVVAFFTTLATYLLVKYIKEKKNLYIVFYALSMICAMYTQYYSFFVIISHWLIMALYTKGLFNTNWLKLLREKVGVFDFKWWIANVFMLVSYLPWFYVAYKQVTRVSGSYWIKPEWITIKTIPGNILQFVFYSHFDTVAAVKYIGPFVYWILVLFVIGATFYWAKKKELSKKIVALGIFGYLPMILVFILSKVRTPIYQDRYFPFSAVALFAMWGIGVGYIKNDKVRRILGIVSILFLCTGIYIMRFDVNHQMLRLKEIYDTNKKSGDMVLSGELYTFLDGSYYFGYDNIKLLSEKVDGYGETSLFYDYQSKLLIKKSDLSLMRGRVWVVGKTGDKDYFSKNTWPGWSAKEYYAEDKNNGLRLILYTR
jgi:mannosyltransferase